MYGWLYWTLSMNLIECGFSWGVELEMVIKLDEHKDSAPYIVIV